MLGVCVQLLYPDSSMDELLKLVDMNHQLACDTETGGCGRSNHIHHLLHAAPPVFTTGKQTTVQAAHFVNASCVGSI